ncbi:MAG: septation protein A [Betaproteobacteria bacterium]
MKFLIDFFPLALFGAAYYWHRDIYFATAVLMAATVMQSALLYAMDRKLQTLQKATLSLVLVFGTLTLALHDSRFIMWKPTVLYTAMALVLGLALWRWEKNYLKLMLGSQLPLPDRVWSQLTAAWVLYFLFMAASNAFVAALYSEATWVNFKLWGYAFPLVFILGQGLFIAKHLKVDDDPSPTSPN